MSRLDRAIEKAVIKNVLKFSDGYTTVDVLKTIDLYTLKRVNVGLPWWCSG